jgi:hypothetical protein
MPRKRLSDFQNLNKVELIELVKTEAGENRSKQNIRYS